MYNITHLFVGIFIFMSWAENKKQKENLKNLSRKKVDEKIFHYVSAQEAFLNILKGRDFLSYNITEKGMKGEVANRLKEVEMVVDTISKDSIVYSFRSAVSDSVIRFAINPATYTRIWVYTSVGHQVNLIKFIDLTKQFGAFYSRKSFIVVDYYFEIFHSFSGLLRTNKIMDVLGTGKF